MTAVITTPSAQACHDSWDGCLECPAESGAETSLTEDPCGDVNHAIGKVHELVVRGFAEEGTPGAFAAVARGGDEDGYVQFRFEREAGGNAQDVAVRITFEDAGVRLDDANDTFTVAAGDIEETRVYRFEFDGGHRHVPFNVTGTVNGVEESIEGVFTVGGEDEDVTAPVDFTTAWRLAWPWLLLFVVAAFILGLLFGTRRRPQAQPPAVGPASAANPFAQPSMAAR